ncbi:MAG: DUF3034 family protein [Sedimentisphaerales bacterium]
MKKLLVVSLVVFVSIFANMALAGVPLNNVEGVGGIAFNPLAYTAGTNGDANSFFGENISKPQIGLWNIHLHEKGIDWTTFGVAETFFKRVELSYGHETVDFTNSKTINKDNFGAKVLLLSEGDTLPAISIGGVFKNTTQELLNSSNSGADYYLVGTKLIKALPWPVLLSGGVLSTNSQTLGVLGFNDSRKEVLFGNVDVIPLSNAAVGFEYRQGAHYDDWKDANYWDAHVAWFVNSNLMLVAAYVNTGDQGSTKAFGLGDGLVLSAQYQF